MAKIEEISNHEKAARHFAGTNGAAVRLRSRNIFVARNPEFEHFSVFFKKNGTANIRRDLTEKGLISRLVVSNLQSNGSFKKANIRGAIHANHLQTQLQLIRTVQEILKKHNKS